MNTNSKKWLAVAVVGVIAALGGWLLFGGKAQHDHAAPHADSVETVWTCSMHPQVRSREPGQCPICGMDLIPVESNAQASVSAPADDAIRMSPTAMKLADVQTAVVAKTSAAKKLRLSGKVQADERAQHTQSAHFPGRIEKLEVDFTGAMVGKGQILAYLYSPELVAAQEELLEARKVQEIQPDLFRAAQEKLKNWKLGDRQISGILEKGEVREVFPVHADIAGVVDQKLVNLGDYVRQGQAMFRITDLSRVWVLFDVYESDMVWVHEGDAVTYTADALPGETFTGVIAYVDPVVNPKTRVARARVEVGNVDLRLKPEMFVSGTLSAEQDGVASVLAVPKSAVMWTGKRSVVYVKASADDGAHFKMREVMLGPDLGEQYVIESGLAAGEELAVHGTFSIDAAAQLAGKPSMMAPVGGAVTTGHQHGQSE